MTREAEYRTRGRVLRPRVTEVSIQGERGRFTFLGWNETRSGDHVLTFIGGRDGHTMVRSFRPERVRTVHRIQKRRQSRRTS